MWVIWTLKHIYVLIPVLHIYVLIPVLRDHREKLLIGELIVWAFPTLF